MLASGFSAADLKKAGFSAADLAKAGVSPAELLAAGFSKGDLTRAGIDTPDANVKSEDSCSPEALRKGLRSGISAADFKNKGCTVSQLRAAGYTASQLADAGFSAKDLRAAGFSAAEVSAAEAAKKAGICKVSNIKKEMLAGKSAKYFRNKGCTADQMKAAGFTASELRAAGFSAEALKNAGFSAEALKKAGFSAAELKNAGFSAADLKKAGFSAEDLKNAGFSPSELSKAGIKTFSPDLESQILSAGSNDSDKANAALERLQKRQEALMTKQEIKAKVSQMQSTMTAQANSLMSSWLPPQNQQFVAAADSAVAAGAAGAAAIGGASQIVTAANGGKVIKAGTVLFAVLDTGINTDQVSPIMATVIQGDLKGSKLLGSFTKSGESVVLSFNTLSSPNFPNSLSVNTVAISQETARTAMASSVDNHYLYKYGMLFASSFLSGLGTAISSSGATVSTSSSSSSDSNALWTVTSADLSAGQQIAVALGAVGTKVASETSGIFASTPTTVTVNAGTGMGILFMSDFALPSVVG